MIMHDIDCQGYEDCRCFHVTVSKERNAAFIEVAEAAKAVVAIDADPDGSVDANGVAIDRLADALAKLEAAK